MWEYSPDLDSYGTPMALMLLPHWTDGCIGSMEGLYFEASATTPYHFLNQNQLSERGSGAQRGLPYVGTPTREDFDLGIEHLQMLGVRYYMAYTPRMIGFARSHPELREIASSPQRCREELCPRGIEENPVRWVIFEVANSALVEGMRWEPVVLTGVGDGHTCDSVPLEEDPRGRRCEGWLDPAVEWYQDPSLWDVPLAEGGPSSWRRMRVEDWLDDPSALSARPLPRVEVTDVRQGRQSVSFRVDRVGVPVLVKVSYFPNWRAKGARGPWRVAPNSMVVVPTRHEVELYYGWEPVDVAGWVLTLAGAVAVYVAAHRGSARRHALSEERRSSVDHGDDEADARSTGALSASGAER
ncbi:MAG: hypothetical protein KatS3mg008_2086 [Acidimicrobiales bacterium]|nr:MAG: hypothetical protein KatS3mg008_2086 [Acidimicrobiales bacterium]